MAQDYKSELGSTGLQSWGGQIKEDFLRELRGKEAYKRYNEMRLNSPVVGAMLFAIEQSIRTISWQYTSDEGADDPRIEFLENALRGMSFSWNDHISEVLTMLPFGYAPFEIVYKLEGKILWRKFAFRSQDTIFRWLFDDQGGLIGIEQRALPKMSPVIIPIEKMVLYRTKVEKNNPEGRSMLRTAWIPYYYVKNIQQIEAIGIERDLAGLPQITLPEGADTDESSSSSDYSRAAKVVRNVRNDEQAGLVIPHGWEFSLVTTGGSRVFDTDKIIRRYESRILMSALAQFLVLGQDKVGTQALSSDLTDFWALSVNAISDMIADTHTKYAAKKLLALNGMDTEGIRMEHTPAGDFDLETIGSFLQQVGNKITWLASDEQWLRGLARLPEADLETIEEERERIAEERAGAFMGFSADLFETDTAPDDDQRKTHEKRLYRLMRAYLKDLRGNLIKEVSR